MDTISLLLLSGVVIITIIIIYLALTNRIIFKMAVRNFTRRKAQSAIVIAGLMIGTSLISASLVVRDTMTYGTEVGIYYNLGEIDEEIWGLSQYGTVVYFNESIYASINDDLSTLQEIEAIAPVVREYGSVFDLDTSLGEPRASILGLDSQILRNTVFGDLDDHGFYPDSLGEGEVAMNSRLADEMDASVGDTIQLSLGAKNITNPMAPDLRQIDLEVVKIIKERELFGKANYNQQKTLFFELDVLQGLLNRPDEINDIWISNKGDHAGGEEYSSEVVDHIQQALDDAVGMTDFGFISDGSNGSVSLLSTTGYFSLRNVNRLLELGRQPGTAVTYGLVVPTISLNNSPTDMRMVMGLSSTEPEFPAFDDEIIHLFSEPMAKYNITEGMPVVIETMTTTGAVLSNSWTARQLGTEQESIFPEEIRAVILGLMDFNTSQQMLHQGAFVEDMATFVIVSGLDNATLEQTHAMVIEQMNADLIGEDLNLEVHSVKADNLEVGRESGEAIGTMFIFLSLFSIVAGIVLIINIFIMMGEERKSEMGMARAVGMKTKHLVRMYIFEGSLYAFVAAIIGAFLGLAFGWIVIQAFGLAFGSAEALGGPVFNLPFHFTWQSVFIAFCAGLLITFATIFFASTRISKLNIIRAIRRIPEPRTARTRKRTYNSGAGLVVVGLLFCALGYSANTDIGWLIGLPLVFIGAALIAYRWISFRLAITVASILIIFVMIPPFDIPVVSEAEASDEAFIVNGLFLVLAGILIVMFNSDILLVGLQRLLGWGKSTRAVLKTAISYPMDSKMKTGMTLGMFALIIFVVTVIAMFSSILHAQNDAILTEQSGGYDILGNTNPTTPFENLSKDALPSELQDIDIDQLETLNSAYVTVLEYNQSKSVLGTFGIAGIMEVEQYQLLGASDSFLSNNGFSLMERDERFETDRDAWKALNEDSSYCIIDGSKLAYTEDVMSSEIIGAYVGGTITITDMGGQNRTRVLTVIGIMDQMFFFQGIMMQKEVVRNEYGGVDSLLLIQLGEGEVTETVAKAFEVGYLELGLQTSDLIETINTLISFMTNFMYLFQGFLGIGLLIGIAGIGIISYRNVIERRQQIGMLRAIGFKKSMIAKSFLIETSFITLLAIFIGVSLGIGTGWQMYDSTYSEAGGDFVIPWLGLIIISLIAYCATILFTFYPSLKASKIPPAEALRYIE
jgi:putative ABC transport system permease protein